MTRPVRPVALVVLTACVIYPGVTLLYQGLYPFWSGDPFSLVGQQGAWMSLAGRIGVPPPAVSVAKGLVGLMWITGVLGLWAGDRRAYPLALAAALVTLAHPGGAVFMAALALVCLIFFRERPDAVPA